MENMPEVWFVNLGIKIRELPRICVSIFGFDIYWYSVMICIGVSMGLLYACREAKRTGQNPDDYLDFFLYAFVVALVGARLYYVVFNWQLYANNPMFIFNIRRGGLAIYGGVIASIIAAYVYAKKKNIRFTLIADTAAPALLLGQAIGRWGNFFNREVFGGFTNSIFAMRYMASQVDIIPASVMEKIVNIGGIDYIQVQPTFLYESACNLILFILLNIIKKRKAFEGEVFFLYLAGYGVIRFYIEYIRTDQLMFFNTGIPVSMLVSAIFAAISIVWIVYNRNKVKNKKIESTEQGTGKGL